MNLPLYLAVVRIPAKEEAIVKEIKVQEVNDIVFT